MNKEADRERGVTEAEGLPSNQDALAGEGAESYQLPEKTRRRRRRGPHLTEKEWYSKSEAAKYLDVAEISVTRYLDRGILHAYRLPTPSTNTKPGRYDYGRLRIHRKELDRYLETVDRRPADGEAQDHAASSVDSNAAVTASTSDEIMTREDAALLLGVSWRTIKRYIESGKLRMAGYFRCPDSYTRAHVYRSEVEKLLTGGKPQPER